MNVALSRGDHLITHFPCYQSHYALAESLGVSVSRWEARPEADWLPDPDELAGLIRPETRAVVLSFPHNPTGALLDHARLEAVVAVCRRLSGGQTRRCELPGVPRRANAPRPCHRRANPDRL